MHASHRHFISITASIIIGTLGVAAAFNWLVDPFNLYDSPRFTGISAKKPLAYFYEPQTKSYALERLRPSGLILGNSRANFGLDPMMAPWSGKGYNAAYGGGSFNGAIFYFQRALSGGRLKQVVLAIDIDMFRKGKRSLAPLQFGVDDFFQEAGKERILWSRQPRISWWAPLLSYGATEASIATLRCQSAREQFILLKSGMVDVDLAQARDTARQRVIAFENRYLKFLYHPDENGKASLGVAKWKVESFKQILRLAHKENIGLIVLINPSHARKYELYRAAGVVTTIQEWKRLLVRVNNEEAQRAMRGPFPIWDFEGYNRYTTERVPESDNMGENMQWYIEGSHYRRELGDLVLARIFGRDSNSEENISDFGTSINTSNIESHFRYIELSRKEYARTHSKDVRDIEALAHAASNMAKTGETRDMNESHSNDDAACHVN